VRLLRTLLSADCSANDPRNRDSGGLPSSPELQ
jgi:hypothetical protein